MCEYRRMAVFIFDDDALQRMAVVEGPRCGEEWLRHMADGLLVGPCAFPTFKVVYMRELWPYRERIIRDGNGDEPVLRGELSATIYGWWGWNRYRLLCSGEIVFLKGFASGDDCVQRAREQGFRVR